MQNVKGTNKEGKKIKVCDVHEPASQEEHNCDALQTYAKKSKRV